MIFLAKEGNPLNGLPSWDTLTTQYGPFLGALIFFIVIVLLLQWYWYKNNIKSKNEEIARANKRIADLEAYNLKLISQMRSTLKNK